MDKMNARDDKYQICEAISYKCEMQEIKNKIDQYDAVVLGDMPSHERNLLFEILLCVGNSQLQCTKNFGCAASQLR